MTEMQRWARSYGHAYQGMTGDRSDMIQDSEGEWVKFAEAEAAIAAAREDALAAAAMTHDPLCPMTQGKAHPLWKAVAPIYSLLCECELIYRVRVDESSDCAKHEIQIQKQTIDKCIAAVEDHFGPEDYELRWLLDGEAVLNALRALQGK